MKITNASMTRFGRFGGQFVPETLMQPLKELAEAYGRLKVDLEFRRELSALLSNYAGRPTPLYLARTLSRELSRKVYLKREDLVHGGAHKLNNVLGQALVAKAMGKTRLIAETGAGQHGVASAMVGANLGLDTEVYMGEVDIERQKMNVYRMELLGARVIPVRSGSRTLKDAINEAMRDWAGSYESTHYLMGTVAGAHPYPLMVKELQSVIGTEAREQILAAEGRLPDSVAACVGGGSNAMGIFSGFLNDDVKLIAVEAGGRGTSSGRKIADHGACLNLGEDGVLHGAMTKILQDPYGQILESYSLAAGLDYPGVGPELAHLVEVGRVTPAIADDGAALLGFRRLSVLEGIIPALESAHAVGFALNDPEALGEISIINLSGRGDKDLATVMDHEGRGGI
ncbi:tryptophan synthase subunit beta [Methanotrichaceae archaeon M04Ac]|uniref:Tryptophan synthase beta chain n=1 Tax=Candidatus Methanocrinis alkalitolerans TaxID=3033395 RepID=A0ABT5XFQ4_9EURY|nr:tryptophan synthase subunit beta [Candidatus Methanocrinis alkalitolerans]MCR3884477.1 tryptophan synthase subunit beta [Methanothrix sp.]MDF0593531.1 tryptophan synthase subunit beta [Candidatus Methanocrinis alkalitolerans]